MFKAILKSLLTVKNISKATVFIIIVLLATASLPIKIPAVSVLTIQAADAPCTVNNVGPDQPSVQAAVNAAPAGSVICLAAGTVTYTAGVNNFEGKEIRGAGAIPSGRGSAGQTVIIANTTSPVFASGVHPTYHTTVSNVKIIFNSTSACQTNSFGLFSMWGDAPGGPNAEEILHNNTVEITDRSDCPRVIYWGGDSGLIYRNIFTATVPGPNYVNQLQFLGHYINEQTGAYWERNSTMGNADDGSNLYFEDNYVSGFNQGFDGGVSNRTVIRDNTIANATLTDHGFDSGYWGERHVEIYNNHFVCDSIINLNAYMGKRGGTGMYFNNEFDAFSDSLCNYPEQSSIQSAVTVSQYKLIQCFNIAGWQGLYPDAYPTPHQTGWGYKAGANTNLGVGGPTKQNDPGWFLGRGFDQTLEPFYFFNNNSHVVGPFLGVQSGYIGECRAMAFPVSSKTLGSSLTASAYVSTGQHALVACSDLVGGSALTISDNLGHTWTPLQGGTNGSLRLSAWQTRITNGNARMTVTISHNSSAAARSCTLITMRQLTTSPVDKNPAVVLDNSSPYIGPATGTLSQSDEVIIGYYALNGPTTVTGSAYEQMTNNDALVVTGGASGDLWASTSRNQPGVIGTTGDLPETNATVGVTYRYVNSTASVSPQISDLTANRIGIAGAVSFKNNGTNPDLQVTDFVQENREYYLQQSSFNGTVGTGSGPRSSRPASCTKGVAYWSTDQGGNWDTSNATSNDGTLDLCTATNVWTNASYTPFTYPHPLVSGASTSTLQGDLNGDHIVNSLDWSIMNSKWFTSDATADINKDGIVNTLDWSIMNSNWFKTG